ncbi:MAG TPA: response regulator [Gaiellaceae bacterium]|nr:response regulator [Gaiellaceae bacterium]
MSRVLVIDDEQIIRDLMLEILEEAGYDAVGAPTAERALDLLADPEFELVVSDVIMPGLSGLELLEEVRQRRPSLPVVLVTGAGTYATLSEALARGAAGLVMKPFSHAEFRGAVASALERSQRSEEEVGERVLLPALATALANAIEARDAATRGHCERLATLACWLAERASLPPSEVEIVRLGAILHDVGKIGIPDRVLLKAESFDEDELELMRAHPAIGDRLLEPLPMLQSVRPVVLHHHERWDGAGYPAGLAGEDIPLVARIVSVADAVEAMWADRPYRGSLTVADIIRELEAGAGSQWDPHLTETMLAGIRCGDVAFGPAGIEVLARPGERDVLSVLLVEDDPDFAELASDAIREALDGARVVVARDAASAAELCRGAMWSLAVLDHGLPDGTGLDVLRVLRESAPRLPVVMLTGFGSDELALEAFRSGADDYVVKGVHFAGVLAGRVRQLLAAEAA